jgi:hypothetical protein
MSYPLTVTVPDELRQALVRAASSAGQTPEEWVLSVVQQRLPVQDPRLRRHFGSVNLGHPTGANNGGIDADLARAYADTHAGD